MSTKEPLKAKPPAPAALPDVPDGEEERDSQRRRRLEGLGLQPSLPRARGPGDGLERRIGRVITDAIRPVGVLEQSRWIARVPEWMP